MTTEELYAELRRLAPHIAFTVSCEPDDGFVWDGDGPDPEEDGLYAVDVTFTAMAIVEGEQIEGQSYLGGHYIEYGDEESLGDVSGYLVQKLEEATQELKSQLPTDDLMHKAQCNWVIGFLNGESQRRYDQQRADIAAGNWPPK